LFLTEEGNGRQTLLTSGR